MNIVARLSIVFTVLASSHACATSPTVNNCTIDEMATVLLHKASPSQLETLRAANIFENDPLASEPDLAKAATAISDRCRQSLVHDADAHVRAMATTNPSWIVRSILLAANRKATGERGMFDEAAIGFAIDYVNTLPWPNPPSSACLPRDQMRTVDVSFAMPQSWYTFRTVPYFACPSGDYEAYLPERGWQKIDGIELVRLREAIDAEANSADSQLD